jgi:hypothetical protein
LEYFFLFNIDNSTPNQESAKKEPIINETPEPSNQTLPQTNQTDNVVTPTNVTENVQNTITAPVENTQANADEQHTPEVKHENGAPSDTATTQKPEEKAEVKVEVKAENGVTPKKGKNGKSAKTTSTKKPKEVSAVKEPIKKMKSETKKKKKNVEESENEHASEDEDEKRPKPALQKSKSEVTTQQRKNRRVDNEEFEKYSNLLNQKTHRKKHK